MAVTYFMDTLKEPNKPLAAEGAAAILSDRYKRKNNG
jgi:hypothetical protein